MFRKTYFLLVTASFCCRVFAQSPQPAVLDTVYDSRQHVLRLIIGSLGASLVTGPVDIGMPLAVAGISPARNYVLAVNGDTGRVYVLKSVPGPVTSASVSVPEGPGKLSLSPTGRSAVLLYQRDQLMIVVTGLPDSPVAMRSVSLAGTRGTAEILAVSDDGSAVAVTVRPAGSPERSGSSDAAVNIARPAASSSLYVDYSGVFQRVDGLPDISALAFFEGSADMLVADAAANRLLRISRANAVPQSTVLASREPGSAGITAVGLSSGNTRIFAASASGDVLQFNSGKGALETVATCSCVPEGMFKMPGSAIFRLNDLPAVPLWVFDGDSTSGRTVFIPVDMAALQATGNATLTGNKETRQ